MGARGCLTTFERSGYSAFIVFPVTDYGNEISRIEDADPVQI